MADTRKTTPEAPRYASFVIPSWLNFDPDRNPIAFLYPDATKVTFTFAQIDEFRRDQIFTSAIFASQTSAAMIVLAVMLCITHKDKRKTSVFMVNILNLLLVIVRGILFVQYFMGHLSNTYETFTWDLSRVPKTEIYESIVSSVMSMLLMIGTQISLILQIRICYALNPRAKRRFLITSFTISAVATTAYLALGIYRVQLGAEPPNPKIIKYANPAVNGLVAFSIAAFSAMFCWRMFLSIKNRRSMGFTGVGSLESLFLSGFQCLVFPALFCIAENFLKFGGSASLAQASVALLLPLSHLWATNVQTDSKLSIGRIEKIQQRKTFSTRIEDQFKRVSAVLKPVSAPIQEFFLACWVCLRGGSRTRSPDDIEAQKANRASTTTGNTSYSYPQRKMIPR
ncbi:hypothetical protein DRE_04115 [Drechslerella stenobrocha 248]|uniref:Pheromone alpha factor receptor n=1 Tax=Drechslerella stenobrocha 248 TaxID=1043628 RepID=W7I376_9PEZI|nr:hypothetical protein DRE_04115 [Drechslerella stenobrocha 248]